LISTLYEIRCTPTPVVMGEGRAQAPGASLSAPSHRPRSFRWLPPRGPAGRGRARPTTKSETPPTPYAYTVYGGSERARRETSKKQTAPGPARRPALACPSASGIVRLHHTGPFAHAMPMQSQSPPHRQRIDAQQAQAEAALLSASRTGHPPQCSDSVSAVSSSAGRASRAEGTSA